MSPSHLPTLQSTFLGINAILSFSQGFNQHFEQKSKSHWVIDREIDAPPLPNIVSLLLSIYNVLQCLHHSPYYPVVTPPPQGACVDILLASHVNVCLLPYHISSISRSSWAPTGWIQNSHGLRTSVTTTSSFWPFLKGYGASCTVKWDKINQHRQYAWHGPDICCEKWHSYVFVDTCTIYTFCWCVITSHLSFSWGNPDVLNNVWQSTTGRSRSLSFGILLRPWWWSLVCLCLISRMFWLLNIFKWWYQIKSFFATWSYRRYRRWLMILFITILSNWFSNNLGRRSLFLS